jgi:V-type H+-transporting ATPase subunit a
MGAIYRSELMSLCQLFLQTDSAFEAVAELGEISLCQFRDLNPDASAYQRKFIHEVRRCEQMERQLRIVREEVEKDEMFIPDVFHKVPTPTPRDIHELEAKFEKIDEELATINSSTAGLKKNFLKLQQIKHVLKKVRHQLDEGQRREAFKSISEQQHMENGNNVQLYVTAEDEKVKAESELRFVAGVIRRDRVLAFERVIWRLCRGNVYARTEDIEMGQHHAFQEDNEMSVFILFFSGEQLRSRVRKICEGFRAVIVDVPETEAQRSELAINVQTQLEDMGTVVGQTLDHRNIVLSAAAQNLKLWEIQVLKLKAVFHTLNMFNIDVTQKCLIAECWIPTDDIRVVQDALMHASKLSGSTVPSVLHQMETSETPPTHFRLNKFTQGFQNIVHAYGIASYREVNPAPFTIISFPFIFAVMFGDTGHGIIMFLAALLLVLFEKKIEQAKIKDEIFNTFYGGRYVILLMGLFSMYTGLVYNDIYSRSINVFQSQWKNPYTFRLLNQTLYDQDAQESSTQETTLQLPPDPAFKDMDGPYPFGLDPIWNLAENKLNFMNPMKMKSSVIIGIAQMSFGLFLSVLNYWHKGSWVDFLFVFIPQLLFLSLIFIYLCVQIVMKWVFFYVRPKHVFGLMYPGSNCAPSLLIGLINMFMMKSRKKGFVDGDGVTLDQCHQQLWYPHQDIIELAFILIAVFSIPVMLLVKPLIQKWKVSKGQHVEVHSDDGSHGEFNFADVMVYQAIHTIEFVLGCISHTASYLRLWALSLAHARNIYFMLKIGLERKIIMY